MKFFFWKMKGEKVFLCRRNTHKTILLENFSGYFFFKKKKSSWKLLHFSRRKRNLFIFQMFWRAWKELLHLQEKFLSAKTKFFVQAKRISTRKVFLRKHSQKSWCFMIVHYDFSSAVKEGKDFTFFESFWWMRIERVVVLLKNHGS